jgi:hypothetical protein
MAWLASRRRGGVWGQGRQDQRGRCVIRTQWRIAFHGGELVAQVTAKYPLDDWATRRGRQAIVWLCSARLVHHWYVLPVDGGFPSLSHLPGRPESIRSSVTLPTRSFFFESIDIELTMKNLFDLTGKVALLSGGSSGLGFQFAKVLAAQGADIAFVARRTAVWRKTRNHRDYGRKVLYPFLISWISSITKARRTWLPLRENRYSNECCRNRGQRVGTEQ